MGALKTFSKRSFWITAGFGLVLGIVIGTGVYCGINWSDAHLFVENSTNVTPEIAKWVNEKLSWVDLNFYKVILPVIFAGIAILSGIFWIILRQSVAGLFFEDQKKGGDAKSGRKKKDFIDQKIEQDRRTRLYLHTLSILQREGRLLDFFQEDLNLYEDDQIGAAVRSIHEDCSKTIKKYFSPKPVVDVEEGEMMTIEAGFDIDAVKLIGNVAGEPPFTGKVKHAGWKAAKKDIPKLSDIQDSSIITPAEIEIE